MGKMTVKRAARFLCVLAALLVQMLTVNATMYFHSDQQRDSSLYETAASVKTESSKTCLVSGAHEVCQSAQITESGETRYFHVCPTDGDPCNPQKCYYSSEPLCCPNTIGLNCIATSDLLVGGEITKVTFNRISLIGAICVVVSPAVNACDADCVLRCPPTDCVNNTICDSDGSNCRCKEGYGSPGETHCCNCAVGNVTHPYYKTNGTCTVYCRSNCRVLFRPTPDNPNGGPCESCRREGFLPPTCCDCDTIGNDTHAFYKTPDGQCKPFCKQNCAVIGEQGCEECKVGYVDTPECCDCDTTGCAQSPECTFCRPNCDGIGERGCESCKDGFESKPDCCRSTKCDKDQDLYFLIDATASNNYLCQLISVVQVLVAAFDPSSTSDSGTKLLAWLFGSNIAEPSLVFDSSTSCDKIVNDRLASLINESNTCLRAPKRTYTSPKFPSLCGQSTSAVSGLQKIATEVGKKGTSGNSAIVMLTDGVIRDDKVELKEVLQKLANTMIIAAGIQDADTNNLKNYTSSVDNILYSRNDPVDLGLQIVAHLNKTGVLCADHANNITTSIKTARENHLDFFCRCHSPVKNDKEPCSKWKLEYPTCGGDLKIGAFRIQTLELEEEILAAVESVLENYSG